MGRCRLVALGDGWLTYQRPQQPNKYLNYYGTRKGRGAGRYRTTHGNTRTSKHAPLPCYHHSQRKVHWTGKNSSTLECRYTHRNDITALFPSPISHQKVSSCRPYHATAVHQPSSKYSIPNNCHKYIPNPTKQTNISTSSLSHRTKTSSKGYHNLNYTKRYRETHTMAMNSPASSYAHLLKRPNTLPPHVTQRHHPWQLYTDHRPWSDSGPVAVEWRDQADDSPQPLPLPPNPNHSKWRGWCYNCLTIGHDQSECRKTERVCAICWGSGHEAKSCLRPLKPKFDPLKPRGNLGEDLMPQDRPHKAVVFMPESNQMQKDRTDMHRAVVVDARLRPEHDLETIQGALMAACNTAYPFPLTHMKGTQYLLLLQQGVDRHTFLMSHARQL